jgi:hypothetical protein
MTCAEARSRRRRDRSPWWFAFSGWPRPSRPSGDHPTASGPGLHRGALATTAGAQRRTAGGGYFVSRCKAGKPGASGNLTWDEIPAAERKIAADAVVGPDRLPSDRPLEGRGAVLPGRKDPANRRCDRKAESELGVIVRTRSRPSSSGIGAHLPGQAGGARPREDDRPQGGGGLH